MLILKRVFICHYLVGHNVFKWAFTIEEECREEGKWGKERLRGEREREGGRETEEKSRRGYRRRAIDSKWANVLVHHYWLWKDVKNPQGTYRDWE